MASTEPKWRSQLTAELARLTASSRTKRVSVDDLFAASERLDPRSVGDPDGRTRLLSSLGELEAAGLVTLPAERSRSGWDNRSTPPVPLWILRNDPVETPPIQAAPRVWPKALEAAAMLATRRDELQLLERIATWLRDCPEPDLVPVQERSLELFDDEKALDSYLKTRLFKSQTLTLKLLSCYAPPLPFVSQHVPGGGPTSLLVVENLATYTLFLTALRERPQNSRPDMHIGWGHGMAFVQSALSIELLDPAPVASWYFGDLDYAGLTVATLAAEQIGGTSLPRLRPATACYEFLLDGPQAWRRSDASSRKNAGLVDAIEQWVDVGLRARITELLAARLRIAQERLGLTTARRLPDIWSEFSHDSTCQ